MYAMQPITYTTGAEIQSPYRAPLQPGNIESGVSLGPASRLAGECLARHVSQPGMCWGKFSSQNTRAVDQYDPGVYGALETQWALASAPWNTVDPTGNFTNTMSYAGGSMNNTQQAMQATKDAKAQEKAMKQAQKDAERAAKAQANAQKQAQKEAAKAAARQSCKRGSGGNGSCSSCG